MKDREREELLHPERDQGDRISKCNQYVIPVYAKSLSDIVIMYTFSIGTPNYFMI